MLTLSDILEITITYMPVSEDTYIQYNVIRGSNTLFNGRFFAQAGTSSITLCLNDIIQNEYKNVNILNQYMQYITVNTLDNAMVKTFSITFLQGGRWLSGGSLTVYMGYSYPFKDYFLESMSGSVGIYPAITGVNYNYGEPYKQTMDLTPHYPNMVNNLCIGQRFVRGDYFKDGPATNIIQLNKNKEKIAGIWSQNFGGYQTTYIANSGKQLALRSDCEYLALETDAFKTKMWMVTCEGQRIIEDMDLIWFGRQFGYSRFYTEHCYEQEPSGEVVNYIVETNNPQRDIDDVYAETSGMFTMSYEEITYAQNMAIEYEWRMSDWSESNYRDFVSFLKNFCPDFTEEFINKELNVTIEGHDDTFILKLPYVIPTGGQAASLQEYFEQYSDPDTYTYEDFFVYESGSIITVPGKETQKFPVIFAKIDACPAKYYLQWIDRFGGVQCQPFDGKETKGIDYSNISITNNVRQKRPVSFNNTLKFEINSKYITDEEMPCYEGLFVSPYIRLLDTKNNKIYDVVNTTNKYIEKTFNNQGKKMFNLTLTLEVNRNENILY